MTGRVTVVGGGLAGISAALRCADAGLGVTLLEVRPRLGGAAYSFERDGLRLDNGQHVFLRCCTEYLALLDRLEARSLVTMQPRLEIPVIAPGGRVAWLRRSGLPAPLHLAGAIARYRHLRPLDRARAAAAALALARVDPDDPRADTQTFAQWLSAHGQRPRAIEALWDLIARPTLNLSSTEASLALAARVFQIGLLSETTAGDIGWATAPLSDIPDTAARRALERAGVDVRLRWRVTQIARDDAEAWTVHGPGGALASDAVILAIPHDRLASVLPAGALAHPDEVASLSTSPIVNLHVVYDRRVMPFPLAAAVGSPVQWIFDRNASGGAPGGQYLAVSLSAATEEMSMSGEELRARYLPALAELFPEAGRASVERFLVIREHAATFRASPGTAARRAGARSLLSGLALAGSYTDTGWPATMEGAVRSGRAAAEALLPSFARLPLAVAA
jgi:squalene-associated FAD-dependent desaturase